MSAIQNNSSLSSLEFERLSGFIYQQSGIKMSSSKKIMVEARLRKRLKELQISSYSEYCSYLFSKEGIESEIVHMVDVITTNKTDFFREPKQFSFLEQTGLQEMVDIYGAGLKRPLGVWSAGCSTGEEPYTLSIVLNEFGSKFPFYNFNILATDISTRVLQKAKLGVYEEEQVVPVPTMLLKKYFLRSKDKSKKLVRVGPVLRNAVSFQRLNFMDEDFGIDGKFDAIFCRNVIIYFDKPTQEKLLSRLVSYILPGGFLFLGHSESILNINLPLVQLAPSTYRKVK